MELDEAVVGLLKTKLLAQQLVSLSDHSGERIPQLVLAEDEDGHGILAVAKGDKDEEYVFDLISDIYEALEDFEPFVTKVRCVKFCGEWQPNCVSCPLDAGA